MLYQTNIGTAHVLWVGDFNRHHPYWDDPHDDRLFTNKATAAAEKLIEAITDVGLDLALPSSTLTHRHNVSKLWSRLDQVFISDHSKNILVSCDTQPDHWGLNTDHLLILMVLDLKAEISENAEISNFQDVDWEAFCKELSTQLAKLPPLSQIKSQSQMDKSCADLTIAIQHTINSRVPVSTITPKSKCWWTKELTQLQHLANKPRRQSYQRRHNLTHGIYGQHNMAVKNYHRVLEQTK